MASRLPHRPTRALLSSLAKQPVSRRFNNGGLHSMAPMSTIALQSRTAHPSAQPVDFHHQASPVRRTMATTSSSSNTLQFPSEALQLKASAKIEYREALTTAVEDAVSASGAFLSQTNDMMMETTVFVMENICGEKLAAFHSIIESMRLSLDQHTQKILEDSYFSLLQPPTTSTSNDEPGSEGSTTAVLQLKWRD